MKVLLISQPHEKTQNHTDHFGGITSVQTEMMTELPQSNGLFRMNKSVFKCLQVRTRDNGTNHVDDHDAVILALFIKNTNDLTIADLELLNS
ncbi:hypothetical protein [Dickeya zeae]|uniref:Uncharacterized protein n=1 Tax=Dickeya zeae TaxID=204042 RepID=A0ABX8VWM9_9GAMM|nr:hypothetical protein [Dickeya zeae]QYM92117.1 hypothetical protein FGI21_09625 [Dickeya zeae]